MKHDQPTFGHFDITEANNWTIFETLTAWHQVISAIFWLYKSDCSSSASVRWNSCINISIFSHKPVFSSSNSSLSILFRQQRSSHSIWIEVSDTKPLTLLRIWISVCIILWLYFFISLVNDWYWGFWMTYFNIWAAVVASSGVKSFEKGIILINERMRSFGIYFAYFFIYSRTWEALFCFQPPFLSPIIRFFG